MGQSEERYNHGLHNEQVCEAISIGNKFPDWTITTAFYASLHFVSSKIFPFKHQPNPNEPAKEILTIEDWQTQKTSTANHRHRLMKELVSQHCSPISAHYDWLHSLCKLARYHNYQQPPECANRAISYMKTVKKFCAPK
jgi:hypothetical protein